MCFTSDCITSNKINTCSFCNLTTPPEASYLRQKPAANVFSPVCHHLFFHFPSAFCFPEITKVAASSSLGITSHLSSLHMFPNDAPPFSHKFPSLQLPTILICGRNSSMLLLALFLDPLTVNLFNLPLFSLLFCYGTGSSSCIFMLQSWRVRQTRNENSN